MCNFCYSHAFCTVVQRGRRREGIASYLCSLSSNPGSDVICGSILLLVVFFTLRGSSPLGFFSFPFTSTTILYKIQFDLCRALKDKLVGDTNRATGPGGGGEYWLLGLSFAGYVPLASQNPYPIIVYSVAIL